MTRRQARSNTCRTVLYKANPYSLNGTQFQLYSAIVSLSFSITCLDPRKANFRKQFRRLNSLFMLGREPAKHQQLPLIVAQPLYVGVYFRFFSLKHTLHNQVYFFFHCLILDSSVFYESYMIYSCHCIFIFHSQLFCIFFLVNVSFLIHINRFCSLYDNYVTYSVYLFIFGQGRSFISHLHVRVLTSTT